MLFNSYTFLIFFAVVLALHNLPFSWRVKKFNLLWASYLFYAAWNPPFVLLLWISTLVDWYVAKHLRRTEAKAARRGLLLLSLAVNLDMLGFFKYGGFLVGNFQQLCALAGVAFVPAKPDIVLPVGISFYTFQTLSLDRCMVNRSALNKRHDRLGVSGLVLGFNGLASGDPGPEMKQDG